MDEAASRRDPEGRSESSSSSSLSSTAKNGTATNGSSSTASSKRRRLVDSKGVATKRRCADDRGVTAVVASYARCTNIAEYTRVCRKSRRGRVIPKRRFSLNSELFDDEQQIRFDSLYDLIRRSRVPADVVELAKRTVRAYKTFSNHAGFYLRIERERNFSAMASRCYDILVDIARSPIVCRCGCAV